MQKRKGEVWYNFTSIVHYPSLSSLSRKKGGWGGVTNRGKCISPTHSSPETQIVSDTSIYIGPCSDCCIPLLVFPVLYCELLGTDPQLPATPDQRTELLLNSTHVSLVHRLPHFTFSLLIIHALFVYYCQCKRNNKTSMGTMLHHVH